MKRSLLLARVIVASLQVLVGVVTMALLLAHWTNTDHPVMLALKIFAVQFLAGLPLGILGAVLPKA